MAWFFELRKSLRVHIIIIQEKTSMSRVACIIDGRTTHFVFARFPRGAPRGKRPRADSSGLTIYATFRMPAPLLARTGKFLLSASPESNMRAFFRDAFERAKNRTKEPDHIQGG
jgi:hypothetical protein